MLRPGVRVLGRGDAVAASVMTTRRWLARTAQLRGCTRASARPDRPVLAHSQQHGRMPLASRSFSLSTARCCSHQQSKLQLGDLPNKVSVRTGPLGRLAKVVSPRESTKITTRVGSSFGGNHSLDWCEPPRNVLFVKKRNDEQAARALERVVRHVRHAYPHMNLLVEEDDRSHHDTRDDVLVRVGESDKKMLAAKVDLVVTLGGDGTILHVSSLFDRDAVPPVLSFSMGTLGFLLPYHIHSFEAAFEDVVASRVSLLLRMRLQQTTHEADGSLVPGKEGQSGEIHMMNEVALHRASSPHMTMVDAFVDGRHLTQAISDGLIIATPTGSTAYSLSAGGPIVHPSVQSLVLTPICPRSLSFRTVLLPSDACIQLKVSRKSRAAAQVSVDGREVQVLQPGQFLQVGMSPYPIPCVNRASSEVRHEGTSGGRAASVSKKQHQRDDPPLIETAGGAAGPTQHARASGGAQSDRGEDDWVGDINTLLRFNASFEGRGLLGGNGAHEE